MSTVAFVVSQQISLAVTSALLFFAYLPNPIAKKVNYNAKNATIDSGTEFVPLVDSAIT